MENQSSTHNTQSFFASFNSRSDKASGAGACTALVTVIAHWLGSNVVAAAMPIVQQFDALIISGSSEWRNLYEKETQVANFPAKHFDLEFVDVSIRISEETEQRSSYEGDEVGIKLRVCDDGVNFPFRIGHSENHLQTNYPTQMPPRPSYHHPRTPPPPFILQLEDSTVNHRVCFRYNQATNNHHRYIHTIDCDY